MTIHEISYSQPNINWSVFSQNTEGVLVRSGQGAYKDYYFEQHYANALKWKKLLGLWHFHQPEQSAELQFPGFWNIIKDLPKVPKRNFLDVEDISFDTYDPVTHEVNGHVLVTPPSKEFHTLSLMRWCQFYYEKTGELLGFYTRKNYWDAWVIPSNTDFWYGGVKYTTPDWSKHPLWVASWVNYSGAIPLLPRDWQTYAVHQYQGGSGRVAGITYADGKTLSPVDYNRFNGTYDQMLEYFEGKEYSMAGTYKQTVLQKDRAKFVVFSDADKQVNIQKVCENADALMLGMVNQIVEGMTIHKDTAFQTWVGRATKPVIGYVQMDQDLFWKQEIDLDDFQARDMWKNETLRALIDQWRSVPIPQTEWDAKKLNITASTGWHKINGLALWMLTTVNPKHGSQIGGIWQAAIVDDLLKVLIPLMAGGYIPKVPIYVMAPYTWFRLYSTDSGWNMKPYLADGRLAGLGITRVWGDDEMGLITDKAPVALPLDSLKDAWQYVPDETYVYPFNLDGINLQFFVWSFNRLLVKDVFYEGATLTPITCGSWCDTPEEMSKILGHTVILNPPVENPPTNPPEETALKDRVTALETALAALTGKLDKVIRLDTL